MPKKLPGVDPALLHEMYSVQRLQIAKIAEALCCSYRTIRKLLANAGLADRMPSHSVCFDDAEVRRMYLEEGKTMEQVADVFKCSKSGVRKHIATHGYLKEQRSVRKKSKRFELPENELREMYLDGKKSDMQIAREHGVSNHTVANWRRKWAIKRDSQPNYVDLDETELKRLYIEEKWTMEKMAQHFGCGESTVRAHIIRAGAAIDSAEVGARKVNKSRQKIRFDRMSQGYKSIFMPSHPMAKSTGYIHEHRYVAECAIGRHLEPNEIVHHIAIGKKDDNRIENLAVLSCKEDHLNVHRYLEKVAVYLVGWSDIRPAPFRFKKIAYWSGQWVDEIDPVAEFKSKNPLFGVEAQ